MENVDRKEEGPREQLILPSEVWQRCLTWLDYSSLSVALRISRYFTLAAHEEGTELAHRCAVLKWFPSLFPRSSSSSWSTTTNEESTTDCNPDAPPTTQGKKKRIKSWGAFFQEAGKTAHERLSYSWTSSVGGLSDHHHQHHGKEEEGRKSADVGEDKVQQLMMTFPPQDVEWMWNWQPNQHSVEWTDFCSSETWHADGTFSLSESEVDYTNNWTGVYVVVHPLELDGLPAGHPLHERWEWRKRNLFLRTAKPSVDVDLVALERVPYIPIQRSSSFGDDDSSSRGDCEKATVAGVVIACTYAEYGFLDRDKIRYVIRPFDMTGICYGVDPLGRDVTLAKENGDGLFAQSTSQWVVEDDAENSLWTEDW